MVASFNGWEDMPEAEREALEQWEQAQLSTDGIVGAVASGSTRGSRMRRDTGGD